MIVAAGTSNGQAEKHSACRLSAIEGVPCSVLILQRASFIGSWVKPNIAACNQLINSWLLQHVAGKLPPCELIKREIIVEGTHHPIAIGPDRPLVVMVESLSVRVANRIEPVARLVLTKSLAVKQPVDQRGLGLFRIISFEGLEIFEGWWKPCEGQRSTPNQCRLVCLWGRI